MRGQAIIVVGLLAATILAGCGGKTTPGPDTATKCGDSCINSDKGAITGVVIDDRYRPVGNATVLLTPLGLTTQSDDEGQFSFGPLDPGAFVLLVTAKDHEAAPKNVDVVANQYTEVELQARRTFSQDGTIITTEFSIFIDCSEEAIIITNEGNTDGVSCMMDQSGDSARGSFDSQLSAQDANLTTYMITESLSNQDGTYQLLVGTVDSTDSVDKVYADTDSAMRYARVQMTPHKADSRPGEGSGNAKWPAAALFTTLIFPHPTDYDQIHGATGTYGAGVVLGFKAKIVQTIFLGTPNLDVGNYTVLKPAS